MCLFGESLVLEEYKPIDITEEKYINTRKKQKLYVFNKNNPFDESISWNELNKHYKNGTLDYDYKIKYPPVVTYLKNTNPEIKLNFDDGIKKIGSSKAQIKNVLFEDSPQKHSVSLEHKDPHDSETSKMKPKSFDFSTFNNKHPKLYNFRLPKISKPEQIPLNPFSSYKKTFYLATAGTALLSTGALLGTVTMFPPLIPILLTYLLPISVISSSITLFKAKRTVKKRKMKIILKVQKFKIKSPSSKFYGLFESKRL